jgi:hypothetical protein
MCFDKVVVLGEAESLRRGYYQENWIHESGPVLQCVAVYFGRKRCPLKK